MTKLTLPFISDPEEITNKDYHNGERFKDFISSSVFENWAVSPKYALYKEINPDQDDGFKPHFAQGSVYHDMLASIANTGNIDAFEKYWHIFQPPINESTGKPFGSQTKKFMEAYEQAVVDSGGKEICSVDDVTIARKMIKELTTGNPHLSKDIRYFLKWGKAEVSHFCQYRGEKFKFRTDLETASKIVDWKTLAEKAAHPNDLHRQIIKFNYHIKAAFYQYFEHEISGVWKSFYWVFQEKEPPFDFLIVSGDNWAYEIDRDQETGELIALPKIGAIMFQKLLDQYLKSRQENYYPGYSGMIQPGWKGQRIFDPKVPGWYQQIMMDYFD